MPEESQGTDAYETVLSDLRAKRDQIDNAITAIEAIRGNVAAVGVAGSGTSVLNAVRAIPASDDDGPGALLGMSISDAAKKLLASKRTTLKNNDLALLFKAGGLILNSKDWVNTIGAVLTRRANDVGDIVKVDRGTWGLKEWYPNRSFKKEKEETKPDLGATAPKEGEAKPIPPPPPPPSYMA